MTREEVAEMAKRLTPARRALILALPADGSWGRASSRSVAIRAWWSGLIDHKHCPEDANEWRLSRFGRAVAAATVQDQAL